jgi:hypothetical protein
MRPDEHPRHDDEEPRRPPLHPLELTLALLGVGERLESDRLGLGHV